MHRIHQEGILLEVERVTAQRTEKETQEMTPFEKFVIEGKDRRTSWQKMEQ